LKGSRSTRQLLDLFNRLYCWVALIYKLPMTMSQFRLSPRHGHLEQLKQIYGYLRKFSSTAIWVQVAEPDFRDLPNQDFDWCQRVYGSVPRDLPKASGKATTTVTYTDANWYHDLLTGRSETGILHLCNQTPVYWCSKRQATVLPKY
jgi:hypothetical protein